MCTASIISIVEKRLAGLGWVFVAAGVLFVTACAPSPPSAGTRESDATLASHTVASPTATATPGPAVCPLEVRAYQMIHGGAAPRPGELPRSQLVPIGATVSVARNGRTLETRKLVGTTCFEVIPGPVEVSISGSAPYTCLSPLQAVVPAVVSLECEGPQPP